MAEFSHINEDGKAVMVDVSDKDVTERVATAKGSVIMQPETMQKIPLCHPLARNSIDVELTCDATRNAGDITATCRVTGRTGVEMEALTAVAVAGLTIYDMCKAVDRSMRIGDIRLTAKSGGRSGDYSAEDRVDE